MAYKYIEEFIGLVSHCPELEHHFNSNENISSSLACINAAEKYGSFSSSAYDTYGVDPSSVLCLVVGDGTSPRTALTAAVKNGWTVVTIDEKLDKSWVGRREGPGNSSSAIRYVGFRGTMNDFLFNGKRTIQSSLRNTQYFQHLIIMCIETTSNFDQLNTLCGRCGVADLRMIYNNIPATVVSVSSPNNLAKCPFEVEASSYIDNSILAANSHVKVWNFESSSKRSFDSSVPSASVTISTSSDTSSMTQYDTGSRQEKVQVSMPFTYSPKVAQLQLQQALAAVKKSEMRSKQRNSPCIKQSHETKQHGRMKLAQPKSKLPLGIRSPISFRRRRVEV